MKKEAKNEQTRSHRIAPAEKKPLSRISLLVLVIELCALAALGIYVLSLRMLPIKYLILALIAAVIVLAVQLLIRKKKTGQVVSIVLSILLIVLSAAGAFYLRSINRSFLRANVEDGTKLAIYVQADSPYETLSDLGGKNFGISELLTQQQQDYIAAYLHEATGNDKCRLAECPGVAKQVERLKGGEVDAIIIPEGVADLIVEGLDEDFLTWARPISCDGFVLGATDNAEKAEKQAYEKITTQPFLLYISGMDTRGDGPIADTGLSDVNIIAAVDPVEKEILLVNVPRDYFVPLYGDSAKMDKLTHAGWYGIDCSMQTLSALFDISFDYYVKVNFNSVVRIVDALGGITVHSDYEFTSAHAPNPHFVVGDNEVNGAEALAFARERYSFIEGDRQRGKNQQAVIRGIIDKITSPAVLNSLGDIPDIIAENVKTNISEKEILSIIRMELDDMAKWTVTTYAVNGGNDTQSTYSAGRAYVMPPYMDTVETAKTMIHDAMQSK